MTSLKLSGNMITDLGEVIAVNDIKNSVLESLRKDKKRGGRGFVKIFKGVFKIALKCKLTPSAWTIFWYMIENISDDTNTLTLNQTGMAKLFNIMPESVAAGLKHLLGCGFVKVVGREGTFLKVMLNPDIGFLGNESKRSAAVEIFDKF